MGHDVFLSYSTKDQQAAEAVCATLERRGVGVWMAPRDILPGLSWASSIVDAIDNARVAVLVYSRAANNSPQIEREVQRAIDKGLTVVPFRIEDVKPSEALAYCIGAVQWLDALMPPMEAHYDRLSNVVRQIAGSSARANFFACSGACARSLAGRLADAGCSAEFATQDVASWQRGGRRSRDPVWLLCRT